MTLGPDGAVYLTDWHDRRTAHPDPDADWDRTNGRIFALRAEGSRPARDRLDLAALPTDALLDQLGHPNIAHVRKARRLLTERHDSAAIPRLKASLLDDKGPIPRLEALWTLHGLGAIDDAQAARLLDDRDEDIRLWTVRFLGDARRFRRTSPRP